MEKKENKVSCLHQDLRPALKRALGRTPSPGETRALVALQQYGGADIDMAICSFIAETNRQTAKSIEEAMAKRHLTLTAGLNRRLTDNRMLLSKQITSSIWWLGGALFVSVLVLSGIHFFTKTGSPLDDCFDGRGKIETNSTGDRYCSPVDTFGQVIKWRLPE